MYALIFLSTSFSCNSIPRGLFSLAWSEYQFKKITVSNDTKMTSQKWFSRSNLHLAVVSFFLFRLQPISAQCCISYRNQLFDFHSKSNDWFLYDNATFGWNGFNRFQTLLLTSKSSANFSNSSVIRKKNELGVLFSDYLRREIHHFALLPTNCSNFFTPANKHVTEKFTIKNYQ